MSSWKAGCTAFLRTLLKYIQSLGLKGGARLATKKISADVGAKKRPIAEVRAENEKLKEKLDKF